MPHFRTATKRDLERLVSLELCSYPVPGRAEASIREAFQGNPWASWKDIWIGEDDGEHAAQALLYPFSLHAWGRRWTAGGVGSVAVSPDQRRRGWGRAIVQHFQEISRERGWSFLLLYPFRVGFYAELGWGLVETRESYRVQTDAIPADPEATRVRVVSLADLDALLPVYDAFARARNGYLTRTSSSWLKRLLKRPPIVVVHEGPRGADGYALYHIESVGENWLHQQLRIVELAWLTDAAWRGLWGFLRNQSDQVAEIVYLSRAGDGFLHFLECPTRTGGALVAGALHKVSEWAVGVMAKIIDPVVVAEGRQYGDGRGRLSVSLTDPLDPAGGVEFVLSVEDGRGRVTKARRAARPPVAAYGGARSRQQPTGRRAAVRAASGAAEEVPNEKIAMKIGTWTEIQCGALLVSQAIRHGQARGDLDQGLWDRILGGAPWGIFDGF